MQVFGLDIGGSGIKGAPVDIATGTLVTERVRIPTPQPATPAAVLAAAAAVVRQAGCRGPIGCGFPAVVKDGVVRTAANIAPDWIGYDLRAGLHRTLGQPVQAVNDADAAGLAEMRWGAGREVDGVVLVVTLGTGIGTALFVKGHLVPNTEFGHIEVQGVEAEAWASSRIQEEQGLSWRAYARRVDTYLDTMERLLWPDLIIIGGGISQDAAHFIPALSARAPVVPAHLLGNAGIAGAALAVLPEPPVPPMTPVATAHPPSAA
jgi:polyphosphate glucokinase